MPLPTTLLPRGESTLIVVFSTYGLNPDLFGNPNLQWCPIGKVYQDAYKFRNFGRVVVCTDCLDPERIPHLVEYLITDAKFSREQVYLEPSLEEIQGWVKGSLRPRLTNHRGECNMPRIYTDGRPTIVSIVEKNNDKTDAELMQLIRQHHPNAADSCIISARQNLRMRGDSLGRENPAGPPERKTSSQSVVARTHAAGPKSGNGNGNGLGLLLQNLGMPMEGKLSDFFADLAESASALSELAERLERDPQQMAMLLAAIKIKVEL